MQMGFFDLENRYASKKNEALLAYTGLNTRR